MSETYEQEWSDWTALAGYKTIASADALACYEWDAFHVLRGPDGRLYVGAGSGCSCNGFSDTPPVRPDTGRVLAGRRRPRPGVGSRPGCVVGTRATDGRGLRIVCDPRADPAACGPRPERG